MPETKKMEKELMAVAQIVELLRDIPEFRRQAMINLAFAMLSDEDPDDFKLEGQPGRFGV